MRHSILFLTGKPHLYQGPTQVFPIMHIRTIVMIRLAILLPADHIKKMEDYNKRIDGEVLKKKVLQRRQSN